MWTDFAWPFCYIGKRRLEDAIQKIDHPIEVIYRCFELDPTMDRDIKENMYESLAKKYGMTIDQAKANTKNVVQMAKEVGLDYHMDTLILTNTFDAHRLTMNANVLLQRKETCLSSFLSQSNQNGILKLFVFSFPMEYTNKSGSVRRLINDGSCLCRRQGFRCVSLLVCCWHLHGSQIRYYCSLDNIVIAKD